MQQLPGGFGSVSKSIVGSYVADWVFIIALAGVTYALNQLSPLHRHFSLVDLSISFPYQEELVSTTSLILGAVVGPAVIILFVSGLAVPGPYASKQVPTPLLIRRKLWEWHTGWLGLALSVIVSLFIVTGLKNVFGKPRPNMLARCLPDTSQASIREHAVGDFAVGYSPYWVLVDVGICTQTDKGALDDAFRSFPSGHSSTSWAGLLYLTLYLCSKFAVVFPFLPGQLARPKRKLKAQLTRESRSYEMAMQTAKPEEDGNHLTDFNGRRNEAAAPPLYLLLFLIVPIGTALYICGSRFFDYRHHGFDIVSGSLIGIFTAWFSFRLYHMPMARGSGWSWGPRSAGRAFGVGVGSTGYVSPEDLPQREVQDDLEMGVVPNRERSPERRDSSTVSSGDRESSSANAMIRGSAFSDASSSIPGKSLRPGRYR